MIKKMFLMMSVFASVCCMAADDAAKAQQGSWMNMALPIILVVVMIFLFSRANKKQQRQRQEMLNKIVKGSKVLLNSGMYGKIVEVRENEFLIEIAENVRVLVVKEGVARVEEEAK
ncbi:MAG: preprotein translocase subunit YajC [Lentisphaeria bacterium]|nr:preprotein translocase subunit YajC [Lentisphaeria bacterium]